jgi:hypothetical protein
MITMMMMMMMMMMMPSLTDSNGRHRPDPKLISEVVSILSNVLCPPPEDGKDDQVQYRSTCLCTAQDSASVCAEKSPPTRASILYKLCSGCHHSPSVCPHKFAPVLVETLRKSPEKQPTLLPCADLVVADLKRVGLLHVHLHIHVDRA